MFISFTPNEIMDQQSDPGKFPQQIHFLMHGRVCVLLLRVESGRRREEPSMHCVCEWRLYEEPNQKLAEYLIYIVSGNEHNPFLLLLCIINQM